MLLVRVNEELLCLELEFGKGQVDRRLAYRLLNDLAVKYPVDKIYITFTRKALDNGDEKGDLKGEGDDRAAFLREAARYADPQADLF